MERAEVLTFTLDLLNFVSKHSDKNKMTSKNLATVFLPALFFSVQGDSTSPEEIMKMAVLGKAVSQTLSFMIDNPKLDPEFLDLSSSAGGGSVTIPAGGGGGVVGVGGATFSGSPTRLSRSDSRSHPSSPASSLKKGNRKRSATLPENQVWKKKKKSLEVSKTFFLFTPAWNPECCGWQIEC